MRVVHCLFSVAVSALVGAAAAAQESPGTPLQPRDLEAIWQDFIQHDDAGTRKAQQGIVAMIRSASVALPFLKERLRPVPATDSKFIDRYIADLDSNDFTTRETASRELEKLAALAGPALERKLKEKTLSLEVRQRLEALVENLKKATLKPEELRTLRAIEVLEGIGNAEAVAMLETMAKGGDGALLTDQARQALARVSRRGGK